MHATHLEPGSAAPLTLPLRTSTIHDRRRACYAVYAQHFELPPGDLVKLMACGRTDDFGHLVEAEPHPHGLSFRDDTHETADLNEAWAAYLDLQYPKLPQPVRSHFKPEPLTAEIEHHAERGHLIRIGHDARRSVPLFELHVAVEEPLCVTHAQACALLAALQSCVASPSEVTA